MAPDRSRPGWIRDFSGHDMHVKLRHFVAQSANIDAHAIGNVLQRTGDEIDFESQHGLIQRCQINNLNNVGPLGNEQEPRPALVIKQAIDETCLFRYGRRAAEHRGD